MPSARARRRFALHATLVLCAAVVVVPAIWIALAAFKTQIALLRGDVLFKPYLGNFDELLFSRSADYGAHFLGRTTWRTLAARPVAPSSGQAPGRSRCRLYAFIAAATPRLSTRYTTIMMSIVSIA